LVGNQKSVLKKVSKEPLNGIKITKAGGRILKIENKKYLPAGKQVIQSNMVHKKILLGLTTTPNSDWKEKIKEIDKLDLKEIALFPTFLKTDGRKELYSLLEKTGIESIPHVHVRSEDMDPKELDYLCQKYKTQFFNIHSAQDFPINFDYSEYKMYLENTISIPTREELKKYSGFCVDFAHWESGMKKKNETYRNFENLIKKYSIGCCHISAVSEKLVYSPYDPPAYDKHMLSSHQEIDYIKKYIKYLPNIISIELENSFTEQLEIKKYLEKIITKN
jgi:hypothetical protein